VRHHDEEERITAAEAFHAHTVGGHQAVGEATGQGRLQKGAPAHYVVWDDAGGWFDPGGGLSEGAMDAPAPTARRTVRAGVAIHDMGER
jgi:predicted amidohydrolase YtcJ